MKHEQDRATSQRHCATPAELVAHGLARAADLPELEKVAARYAIAVTPAIADLIDPDDPDDPIARQFIPTADELQTQPGENADPIGDHAHSPVAGIVHRYPDRVLFKLVHVCAVYCRFCFRREMVGPGKDSALSDEAYGHALAYIRAHTEIWEVILTGGDPLMLSPRRLAQVMTDLAAIDHVRIIRIHTRVPVADPARINEEMVAALKVEGATTWVALHANHASELTAAARAACARLVDAGIPMVSQSVLLPGVNDNAAVQTKPAMNTPRVIFVNRNQSRNGTQCHEVSLSMISRPRLPMYAKRERCTNPLSG